MPTFSERYGYTPVRSIMQREAADDDLRTALWNFIYKEFLVHFNRNREPYNVVKTVWINYFHKRIDELNIIDAFNLLKDTFLIGAWYQMYDLLEVIPKSHFMQINQLSVLPIALEKINIILKQQLSAYRFVNGVIVEITSNEEIAEIEQAINTSHNELTPVKSHLKRALELLSDRNKPDYRNSIKESISAIESFSCIITQEPNATLGKALKIIEKNHNLHPCLKSAFTKLYEYTSDSDGIRHALLEESTLKQEDAKFMLVTCSAFINYLIAKTS